MSDVAYAPAPAAPGNSAGNHAIPQASEVPINPNPVSVPSPVTNQPPAQAPAEGSTEFKPRPSRRETIEAAFKKHEAETPKAKPAEARMGHNRPPEPTEPEAPLDLRKRPQDQPRVQGRFAPRQEGGASTPPQQGGVRAPTGQPGATPNAALRQAPTPLPEYAPYRAPPPRMHPQAQQDWHSAPESVRGEVYRMAKEFHEAYQRNQADVREMESLRPYQHMAQQHNTTLQKALQNYTGMEQLLRTDLVAGLDLIVHNLNLQNPENNQRITLRDVAYHILTQSPEQHKLVQSQNTQMAQSHQMQQLAQRQAQLEYRQQQQYAHQQFVYSRSAVDQYAASRPRFDELSDLVYAELTSGYDLDMAYRRAELLRPATHAAQTRSPSAQTRPPDRSISGAPDGADGPYRRREKSTSVRSSVEKAIAQANGF